MGVLMPSHLNSFPSHFAIPSALLLDRYWTSAETIRNPVVEPSKSIWAKMTYFLVLYILFLAVLSIYIFLELLWGDYQYWILAEFATFNSWGRIMYFFQINKRHSYSFFSCCSLFRLWTINIHTFSTRTDTILISAYNILWGLLNLFWIITANNLLKIL